MAVTHIATPTPVGATATSVTLSVTVASGTDRFLLAQIGMRGSATLTDLTFNGVSIVANSVGTVLAGLGNTGRRVYLVGLVAPTVGTFDLIATPSASAQILLAASTFTGVDQTTPTGPADTEAGTGSSTAMQVDPISAVNDIAWSVICNAVTGDPGVKDASLTEAYPAFSGGTSTEFGAAYRAAAAGTTPMPWTYGTPAAGIGQALIGVAIKAVASTASATRHMMQYGLYAGVR